MPDPNRPYSSTISSLVNYALNNLPPLYQKYPWTHPSLHHGTKPLCEEIALNCYLASYGGMHQHKLNYAFSHFPPALLSAPFEIFDWGCGQGLATIEFIDYLKSKTNGNLWPERITLLEPSPLALERAKSFINSTLTRPTPIETINTYLPANNDLSHFEFQIKYQPETKIVIHLFSNILDIAEIDLKKLANLITREDATLFIFCIGPCNSGQKRIDAFSRYFALKPQKIFLDYQNYEFGYKKDGHPYTCRIKAFEVTPKSLDQAKYPSNYYPSTQYFAGYQLNIFKDANLVELSGLPYPQAFEIWSPFDLGACVCYEPHPILAVLNNIVTRGLPTLASPRIEKALQKEFPFFARDLNSDSIEYKLYPTGKSLSDLPKILVSSPLAIARVQKTVLTALLLGKLKFRASWKVLVIERDVPGAALALAELSEMFNHLAKLSRDYSTLTFPKMELEIISFYHSKSSLQLDAKVSSQATDENHHKEYDLIIDLAVNQFSDAGQISFEEFKAKENCYFYIRSSLEIFAERTFITTERIVYQNLMQVSNGESSCPIVEKVTHLRYFLQLLFRKKDFRPGQLPILNRALQLKSVIGLLPTGGGKSLTYQLAAFLQPGVTLVVDPITSLMKDQYDGLLKNGIDGATFINTQVDKAEKEKRSKLLSASGYLLFFLSPERLGIESFRIHLKYMAERGVYFSYGVIDEVHCVSEWGHDFRFSYLHLGRNLCQYALPKSKAGQEEHISLFGLTATASFDVLADVERELSGPKAFALPPDATVRYENTNRLELQYRVIHIPAQNCVNPWDVYSLKSQRICQIIQKDLASSLHKLLQPEVVQRIKQGFLERENISDQALKQEIEDWALGVDVPNDWYKDRAHKTGAIIFCPHRQGSLGVKDSPKNWGIASTLKNQIKEEIATFVGGDDFKAQDDFIHNKTSIMVATKAFGMGIDKPNIRFTINMNHSGSLEGFVQEAGRAGRDRKMALALILYSDRVIPSSREKVSVDFGVHQFFHNNSFMGNIFEKAILYYLFEYEKVEIEENTNQSNNYKLNSITGWLKHISSLDENQSQVYYLRYIKNIGDYYDLNNYLKNSNLQCIDSKNYETIVARSIYRMCCIGLIEDFTQEYSKNQFRIIITKKPKGAYYQELSQLMLRYFGEDRAKTEAEKAKHYQNNSEIYNCLFFLTDFVYAKIALKRLQAIRDMEDFCKIAISNSDWIGANEILKDHIYYYFNSKYARISYIAPNGENFSLKTDTDNGRIASFAIVKKYMQVINDSLVTLGTPKDNVKHLQGAVRLIRRSVTEPNPALDLLNVFCILYLKNEKVNVLIDDMERSYLDAYLEFFKIESDINKFNSNFSWFKNELSSKRINIATDEEIENLDYLEFLAKTKIHTNNIKNIVDRFLS